MAVTVYSKPGCVQCNATYRALDKNDIEYNVINVAESPESVDLLLSKRKTQMPVVVIDVDGDWDDETNCWTGFQSEKIEALANQ